MPNITFTLADFRKLLGRKTELKQIEEDLLMYAKGEVERYDAKTDELTVNLDDTNLPALWCPEGLARLFRQIYGLQKGTATVKAGKGKYDFVVERSVQSVRPYIAAFVARGRKGQIDDYLLKQLIQMQEKFCEGYGRRRQKVSIGLYSYKRLSFPISYKAVEPKSVSFVPLEESRKMSLSEILERHQKGIQYRWILEGQKLYPLLADSKGQVLSFPPIINSNFTGRLEAGDSELLFEATGPDEESVGLAANIFAQNMHERGFEIVEATMHYPGRKTTTPALAERKIRVTPEDVEKLTGLKLKPSEIKQLLAKMGYGFEKGLAIIPHYRNDILHTADVVEDVAIAYGFDKIPEAGMASHTMGGKEGLAWPANSIRKAASGMGFQEVFSHILADKSTLAEGGIIELENPMSETYSAVRNSLLPGLLDVLSRNKHADYPQKIFEEGIVASRQGGMVMEARKVALVSAHSKADFTEQKQYVAALLACHGKKAVIEHIQHPLFIEGRAGAIIAGGKAIGVIGEISPAVLSRFGIETPAVAAEIDVEMLIQ